MGGERTNSGYEQGGVGEKLDRDSQRAVEREGAVAHWEEFWATERMNI